MSSFRVSDIPLLSRLEAAERILVCGGGGGFDVFAGLPLYLTLRAAGKHVELANLTFTYLGGTDAPFIHTGLAEVTAKTRGEDRYSPERYLCEWLDQANLGPSRVFCFEKLGVRQITSAYRHLVSSLDIDAILVVDGGTDLLMRGDESGLGTPSEDAATLAAVSALDDVPIRLASCLGFGIDTFHGVCHAHFLENVAALTTEGAYLGAHALVGEMTEAAQYLEAVEYVHQRMPQRQSIVNGCIASALEGRFGNSHRTERTRSSELFINPLMTIYFSFDLPAIARRNLYLESIRDTDSIFEVVATIEAFRKTVELRPERPIPH